MKLTTFLMFLFVLQLYAENSFSQSATVRINNEPQPLKNLIADIEEQTGYLFVFSEEDINTKSIISVETRSEEVSDILNDVFSDTNITYYFDGKYISLKVKDDKTTNQETATVQQQTISIKGTVQDELGPVIGANVIVKGTTNGTVTDRDGAFALEVAPNAVLVVSYIGYVEQEIQVNSRTNINVLLVEDRQQLEEVVVTALGIKRAAKTLSYATAEVKGDDLQNKPELNIMNSLQGTIAGVDINIGNAGPTAASSVKIRGNTSINRDNNPLYVIDGIPITRANVTSGSRDMGDALSSINQRDIESISVLKGAAATALYGSRAANGVIIISTKNGSQQKGIGVQYSGSFGFENFDNPFKGRQKLYGPSGANGDNSDLYPRTWNEEVHRNWGPLYDGRDLGLYFDNDQSKPIYYDYKEDHWKQFMRTGSSINNSLSLTGGGEDHKFRVSASDLRYTSPVPNSKMNRQTANISTNSKIAKIITFNARLNYSTAKTENRPNTDRYARILTLIPTNWDINWLKGSTDKWGAKPDGWMLPFSTNDYYQNPYWSAYQDHQEDQRDRISANADIRIDVTPWLAVTGRIGNETTTLKMTNIDAYGFLRGNIAGTGAVAESTSLYNQFNADYSLIFNKSFKDFGVVATFGGSITRDKYNRDGIYGNNLLIPFYHVVTNAGQLSSTSNNVNQYTKSGINSLYGSVELSYKDWIYLTATGRNDWFSSLAPENNSIFYPSVGLSYLPSSQFTLPTWWSFAKLRASYAEVGGGASPYDTKIAYDFDAIGYLGTPTLGLPNTIANANLQPYNTREYELGFDFRFFNNRIGIDYAWYDKKTTNDIVSVTLPQSAGYTGARVNLGTITNKGHEVMLTLVPVRTRDFDWTLNMMYSYNRGKILDLGGVSEVNATTESGIGGGVDVKHIVGKQPFAIYGYKQKEVDGKKVWEQNSFTYGGQSHKTWRPARDADKELLGYGINPHAASISSTLSWKGVSLSFMIDGKFGGKIVHRVEQEMIERGTSKQTLPGRNGGLLIEGLYETGKDGNGNPIYADVSTVEGYTINANPSANLPNDIQVPGNVIPYHVKHFEMYYREGFTKRVADMVVFDGSYVKFRQISLGYSIPKSFYANIPIQRIDLSLVGYNLFDIYNDLPNGDPSTGRGNGINNSAMPSTRSFTLNLNVNF
ncbi:MULTISPECIES: SusC/RagA family TonB-linked outer membrane protein [unclassified Parabacteroides]|uniref:SusC/RagA family TonB-linked outer membrane protein n=1 Tax=unclassified Parabacteroides TaxID=2649774 RepID=UPI002474B8F9|nr:MULTISPECIES: SusC/RagA family TonB-linked outer membrane protein [unclassified Parabacteroides]